MGCTVYHSELNAGVVRAVNFFTKDYRGGCGLAALRAALTDDRRRSEMIASAPEFRLRGRHPRAARVLVAFNVCVALRLRDPVLFQKAALF